MVFLWPITHNNDHLMTPLVQETIVEGLCEQKHQDIFQQSDRWSVLTLDPNSFRASQDQGTNTGQNYMKELWQTNRDLESVSKRTGMSVTIENEAWQIMGLPTIAELPARVLPLPPPLVDTQLHTLGRLSESKRTIPIF